MIDTDAEYKVSSTGKRMRDEYNQPFAVARISGPEVHLAAGFFGDTPGGYEKARFNAELFAEAINVFTQEGMRPGQLAEKVAGHIDRAVAAEICFLNMRAEFEAISKINREVIAALKATTHALNRIGVLADSQMREAYADGTAVLENADKWQRTVIGKVTIAGWGSDYKSKEG